MLDPFIFSRQMLARTDATSNTTGLIAVTTTTTVVADNTSSSELIQEIVNAQQTEKQNQKRVSRFIQIITTTLKNNN